MKWFQKKGLVLPAEEHPYYQDQLKKHVVIFLGHNLCCH